MPTELERELAAVVDRRHAIHGLIDAPHVRPRDASLGLQKPKHGPMRAAHLAVQRLLMRARRTYYVRALGMQIDPSAWFSLKVHLDRPIRAASILARRATLRSAQPS